MRRASNWVSDGSAICLQNILNLSRSEVVVELVKQGNNAGNVGGCK